METVEYRSGYKVITRPIMVSQYRNGCLISQKQKVHTVAGKCGKKEIPIFHETWIKCS